MTREEKLNMNIQNIETALEDYGRYTRDSEVLEDVSRDFIMRVAHDNLEAKEGLRNLFRKSPVWNEKLDAIVINGNRTHDPDYGRIENLANEIIKPWNWTDDVSANKRSDIHKAMELFTNPDPTDDEKAEYIEAIKRIAPHAYAPNKKLSRVFKGICDALGVTDETKGSEFQRKYAELADELSTKQISYKLYVSVNPAHFITMSNPKRDCRGSTLTSCHSFNSTEYKYNTGCSGYARDPYTFIAFTAADDSNPETLNNRKTSRQLFGYIPNSGVLLQSRLYNTDGGTYGAQGLSKEYRDLIQREISALEDVANLWKTYKYVEQHEYKFDTHEGFGGYPDWTFRDFDAKVSVRAEHDEDCTGWTIGEWGICVKCGYETNNGVYCEDCEDRGELCYECEERFSEDELYPVYSRYGNRQYVCEYCRDNYYTYCDDCDEYYENDCVTYIEGYGYVCDDCLSRNYEECAECGHYHWREDMASVGDDWVCENCLDRYYVQCDECGEYIRSGDENEVIGRNGYEAQVCDNCRERYYVECDDCGAIIHTEYAVADEKTGDTLCPDCHTERMENDEAEQNEQEVA